MNTKLNEGPDYYQRGNIEVWDFIRDQSLNYHLGNVVKYVCRAGYKDDDLKDLKKLPTIYLMKSNQEQAKEFRKKYNIKSSDSKPVRQYQCDLITERV